MGRTDATPEEFHNFLNVTQAILWQAVATVKRARIDIADSRKLRDEARELLAALHRRRRRPQRPQPLRGTLMNQLVS